MKKYIRTTARIFLISLLFSISCNQKKENLEMMDKNYEYVSTTEAAHEQYQLIVHANQRVASLQMPQEAYDSWTTEEGFYNQNKLSRLTRYIYSQFQDQFDFIFLVLNEKMGPKDLAPAALKRTSNAVLGLGIPIFNHDAFYGSDGKLKSVILLAQRDGITHGPSLHALLQNWGNFIIKTYVGGYWGFMGANVAGQLGGFKQETLKKLGNNRYAVQSFGLNSNNGNTGPYSDFELYLMGLIPIGYIAPFDVFDQVNDVVKSEGYTRFSSSHKTNYTPEDILQAATESRNPSSENSQKDFSALVLVLTPKPLTNWEWAIVDESAALFSRVGDEHDPKIQNFWEATSGLAMMHMRNLNDARLK